MLHCWHESPDVRPTFDRLYQIVTELLEEEVRLRRMLRGTMKPVLAFIQVGHYWMFKNVFFSVSRAYVSRSLVSLVIEESFLEWLFPYDINIQTRYQARHDLTRNN